jgi:SAM-dependent methyltransferase
MIFRDPNTLYRTNHFVGALESAQPFEESIRISGRVDAEAIRTFGLDQVVLLDLSDRYVSGISLGTGGEWSLEITSRSIGGDNSCLGVYAFAACEANRYIFPLHTSPSAKEAYKAFVKARLPDNSKDVPSLKSELRELIIKATRVPYVARSIHQLIPTGNNYQTLALDSTLRQGGRQSRENFLYQVDFNGKTVLDIGANTGENSRIVRKLGASLVDGYEYDPYFVEIGRAVNALTGMTRVSLFQGDCTRSELFKGMKYDVVVALSVWVYMQETIKDIAKITDIMIFETHTLDHGIEFYYQPILEHFPHAISLGYSDKPLDPHKSRMFVVFGKERATIENMVNREFLRVEPYFKNPFVEKHKNLSKAAVLALAKKCFEKHSAMRSYASRDYVYGTDTYFEVFLAGLHQFAKNEGKIEGLVEADNLYLSFLKEGIKNKQIDQNLKEYAKSESWMIRKISNKYEDAFYILNGYVDRVAPVEIVPQADGQLKFTSVKGEEFRCEIFDGHHRFFMCELSGTKKIHYVLKDGKTNIIPQGFERKISSNYTLKI